MEMDRMAYIDEKKTKQLKKANIIATLTEDQKKLCNEYNTVHLGPHAKKCKEVILIFVCLKNN